MASEERVRGILKETVRVNLWFFLGWLLVGIGFTWFGWNFTPSEPFKEWTKIAVIWLGAIAGVNFVWTGARVMWINALDRRPSGRSESPPAGHQG